MYTKGGIPGIREAYEERLEKTIFDYQWLIQPLGAKNKPAIYIDVHVPIAQKLRYIPGVLEVLKMAWTQYLALLIPALVIFWTISGFLFRN